MGTMPRSQAQSRPMAQPMARPGAQQVTGGRTTLAQRQAMTPFRNYNKPPVAKMNPLTYVANQQAMTQQPPPPMNLPDIYGYPVEDASFMQQPPAPNMVEAIPEQDYMPSAGFGGGKSNSGLFGSAGGIGNMVGNAVNQGLQGAFSSQQPPQPFNLNPNPVSNMGGGQMKPQQQYNGQLDLSSMMGQPRR